MYSYILSFTGSVVASLVFIAIYRVIAQKIGLVDKPNARKVHTDLIPLVGGIGVFSAVILMNFIDSPEWLKNYEMRNMFIGASVLMLMGVLDDKYDLKATWKLSIQILIAHFMYYHGVGIDSMHGVFGVYEIPVFMQHILTIVIMTGVINAFNLMDGIDGLAAGLAIISFIALTFLAVFVDQLDLAFVFISFIGALLGFLYFNFNKKKKTFMGDAGSLLLGFIIVCSAMILLRHADTPERVNIIFPSLIGILLIPVFDSLRVYMNRIGKGKSPFKADKSHIHHLILQLGFKHKKASFMIVFFVLLIVSLGIFSHSTLGVSFMLIILVNFFKVLTNILELNSKVLEWKEKILRMENSEILR